MVEEPSGDLPPSTAGDSGEDEPIPIAVVVEPRPELPLVFANHAEITHSRFEFFLTFSQVIPPNIRTAADVHKLDALAATPVARVVMSPALMESLVAILEDNLRKYKRRQERAMVESASATGESAAEGEE